MPKHLIGLDDLDFDDRLSRAQQRITQEIIKSRWGKDCFVGREVDYCSVYGTYACKGKCLYAKRMDAKSDNGIRAVNPNG